MQPVASSLLPAFYNPALMFKKAFHYFDFGFYLRFAGLFFLFYLGYTFVIATAAPTGTYYPFVDRFLNFPAVIRYSVLHVGQFFLSLLGYTTTIAEDRIISADGYSILQMAFPCYGLGVKSFWVAFVWAHKQTWRQKLNWSVIGVVTIFLLNCIRVAVLMISMVDKWSIADSLGTNAHDFFNYLCYAALLCLILFFYSKNRQINSPLPSIKSSSFPI
ncbi:MAG: hypothetical protein EOO10_08365 [Chitinophagaceae bacterium]|nr:MAG: hypothetical protein EOO10_08365 [Chitinophagaceae bacterium]